jgi:coenzyme F420-reducing hydrogenase alpha subunit
MDKFKETAENIGSKILGTDQSGDAEPNEFVEGVKDKAEDIGETILEKGGEALDKAKSFGESVFNKANELVEKAQEEAAKDAEGIVDKAKDLNEQMEQKIKENTENMTGDDSLLGGHDSFFDKAARFADGDYHMKGQNKPAEDDEDMKITKDPNYKKVDKNPDAKVAGFEDLDGDGDEIIDDAIIDEE